MAHSSFCKWIEVIEENAIFIRFLFFFWNFNSLLIIEYHRPNWRIVGKLTTDVVTYCTEASIKNQNMRTGNIVLQKKHCLEAWSKANNLTLNRAKSVEIIFTSNKGKLAFSASASPPPLPGITCCSTLKILGVTVTNTSCMAEHIQNVIKSSSQTLHALRILRSHGMSATIIEHIFQAVVIAKLTYAFQSWSGFTSAADIQQPW